MSKMDSYMQGRTEGMEFALRLVKDKGIEELEKEIKFRQRTGISLNVTRQELNAASNKIKEMTLDTYSILSVACLCDLWGFGKKRCQQFMDKMSEGAQYLVDDLATWDDYRQAIQERLGFEIKIKHGGVHLRSYMPETERDHRCGKNWKTTVQKNAI